MGEIDLSFMPQGTDIVLLERILKSPHLVYHGRNVEYQNKNAELNIDNSNPYSAMLVKNKAPLAIISYEPFMDEEAFLSKDSSLIDRIMESDKIVSENNLSYKKISDRLRKITDIGKYKIVGQATSNTKIFYQGELYARHKPLKSYKYEYMQGFPSINMTYSRLLNCDSECSTVFRINRYRSPEEEHIMYGLMNIEQILLTIVTWEDEVIAETKNNLEGALNLLSKEANKIIPGYEEEYHKLKSEEEKDRKIMKEIEAAQGPSHFEFTELLVHLIEKYHFFPNNERYAINIPFFLKAIGLKKM